MRHIQNLITDMILYLSFYKTAKHPWDMLRSWWRLFFVNNDGGNHMAGIVPAIGPKTCFGMLWGDGFIPVAPKMHAIELAVLECAYAGCTTIWVVIDDVNLPLARSRLGEMIQDPIYISRRTRFKSLEYRAIPIFYIPMPTWHSNKEECVSWTILHGALTAKSIGKIISKWVMPDRFYISFPHGIISPRSLRPFRDDIMRAPRFALTLNDIRSTPDTSMLSFRLDEDVLLKLSNKFQHVDRHVLQGSELSDEKEYYKTEFPLDKFFSNGILELESGTTLDVSWYHQIDSWDNYCEYLGSEHRKEIQHPGKLIMGKKAWNPIGLDVIMNGR
jgi:hypothetical protein